MPRATTDDRVALHWEETGSGEPLLLIHEFGGDSRSWHPQVAHFARRYRCLVYNARGYPPSDVPADPGAYSQQRAVADAVAVLDAAGVDTAHVIGNSMGGFCALHLGLRHPDRVRSLVVAGCGYGAHPDAADAFRATSQDLAARYDTDGAVEVARSYGASPARLQLRAKDPAGYAEHLRILAEHDVTGAALTMRGVQAARPSLYALRDELAAMAVPTLIVAGDCDDDVLDADLMLKRTLPRAGLAVLPRSGHLTNLEEPALFNGLVEQFHAQVAAGRWA
ncbi:alpha/beta fold hydrolase [Pseudonocardia bannensis]|uniref:Alpha/beta fold hydrolase n=1 Tax=Pseudonocardia bannensis TaxID=630973 RepID=A0A848DSH3_9PSEU|nr:alpha/beta hydrolase [Pseudonocardia bannensis]NMH95311.1 alpha/beta fold hydrolase [Pseudonocardia bannensis]